MNKATSPTTSSRSGTFAVIARILYGGLDDAFLNQAIVAWQKLLVVHVASSGPRCLYKIETDFILNRNVWVRLWSAIVRKRVQIQALAPVVNGVNGRAVNGRGRFCCA
jgi:hypothetical protein